METKISDFKHTDPDNFQFGREVRGGVFHFKEFDRQTFMSKFNGLKWMPFDDAMKSLESGWNSSDFWVDKQISLADYSEQEIESHISSYYEDLDEVKETYGDDWMFIVAECIFEQESGLY